MKLSNSARTLLRQQLREHPELSRHLSSKSELIRLTKDELLRLASKLNVQVGPIPEFLPVTQERGFHDPYGFQGAVDFELTINLLGETLPFQARIVYEADPEWEFYDFETEELAIRTERATMHAEILVHDDKDEFADTYGTRYKKKKSPTWEKFDLFSLISRDLELRIDELIDEDCRKQDRSRRKAAGVPVDDEEPKDG